MKYRIKEVREEKRLSQEDLSRQAGVSRAIISGLESGKRQTTTTTTICKLAVALGVGVQEILSAENA